MSVQQNFRSSISRSIKSTMMHRGVDGDLARHIREKPESCYWCGNKICPPASSNRTPENLAGACASCDEKKHDKEAEPFAPGVRKTRKEIEAVLLRQEKGRGKLVTIFHLERFGLDAYIFHGFDKPMIEDGQQGWFPYAKVSFHVLRNGFRAFACSPVVSLTMRETFEEHGYDVIDRRKK